MNEPSTGDPLLFVCSSCEERIEIDEEIRDVMIRTGCVLCDAELSSENFEQRP